MKKMFSLLFAFMCWTGLGWANSEVHTNQPIYDMVDKSINSVRVRDVTGFKSLAALDGILVVRYFVSGGYGTRGKNIRDLYKKKDIPKNLHFAVRKEAPISISDMFAKTLKADPDTIKLIELNNSTGYTFEARMATSAMVRNLAKILRESKANNSEPALIALGGNGFVLAEAQMIDNNPDGAFAIFTRKDDHYYLQALVDLR